MLGHVGPENKEIERIRGGYEFGYMNEDGERILDLAFPDKAIENT